MSTQMHIYENGRIHIQEGSTGDYEKYDLSPSDSNRAALEAYYAAALNAGMTNRSFADTSTPYVPVEVVEKPVTQMKRVVRFTMPSPMTEVEI